MKKKFTTVVSLLLTVVMLFSLSTSELSASAGINQSYETYLADYLLSSEHSQSYINRDFYIPYRKYVEDRRNSDVYQGLLTAWTIATFDGSVNGLKKATAYYETILYDTLFGGLEGNAALNDVSSIVDSTKAGTMETLLEYCQNLDESLMADWEKSMDFDSIEQGSALYADLAGQFVYCDNLKELFSEFSDLQDGINKCKDIAEAIEKVSKVKALSDKFDELTIIVTDISTNTNDPALKAACARLIAIMKDNVPDIIMKGAFIAESYVWDIVDDTFKAMWTVVVEDLSGAGFAVKAGQKAGKLLTGWFFSTDKDIECVYSMDALYTIEDITVELVKKYQTQYKSNRTDANAKLYSESFKLLMKIFIEGVDYSKEYAQITTEKGIFNQLFKNADNADYKHLLSMLDQLRTTYESYLNYVDACVYNNYVAGIPNTSSGKLIKKNIVDARTSSVNEADISLYFANYEAVDTLYTNHFISENMTLDSDYHTYGDLYVNNGTIDLNGYTMTIEGDVYHKQGTIKINNGTLNVSGDYIMENSTTNSTGEKEFDTCNASVEMKNEHDKINISGDLITHKLYYWFFNSFEGHYTYGIDFENGVCTIGGNIWTDYSFQSFKNNKIVLNGDSTQSIYIGGEKCVINELEILNPDTREIVLDGRLSINRMISNANFTTSKLELLTDFDVNKQKINLNGNLNMINGTLDLNGGILSIDGDFIQQAGTVKCNNGTFSISGDYAMENATSNSIGEIEYNTCSAKLIMQNKNDKVNINGDFTTHSLYYSSSWSDYGVDMSNGVITFGGDVWSDISFSSRGNNKVILNGTGTQNIYLNGSDISSSSSINELEVISPDNCIIHCNGKLNIYKMLSDVNIESDNLTIYGIDLNQKKMTIDGDVTINDYGTINLNGGTLSINGNLFHTKGTLTLNNGTLNISGNYIMQDSVTNNIGEVEYNKCSAVLNMQNNYDKFNIKGAFITHNVSNGNINLKTGIITIYGNIWSDSGISISSSYGHRTILAGNKKQSVTLGSSNKFNILVLTQSKSNYIFNPENCWNTLITVEDGSGDANGDGEFTVADVVLLQKWLLAVPNTNLPCWKAVDINNDSRLDVFDLCLLKRMLINS